jgi:parallel beta-helix repeat protein
MGGTYNRADSFYPPRNGMPNAWIVYKAYGDSPVNFVYTGTSSNWTAIFHSGNSSFPNGKAYLEFNGFTLDGKNQAVDGFFLSGSHHIRIRNNTIKNFGAAGIATVNCDYIMAEKNLIHHVGYGEGWASGITMNSNKWFDSYAGFHNIVVNNIIAGSYDNSAYHTDGNGIIMDLGGSTPPVLIINNVVYGNGGRCIQALSNTNFWIVNNTCHKNGLDTSDSFGSLVTQNASDGYFINSIANSWNGRRPYDQQGSNSNVQYHAGMYYGGSNNFSNSQLIQADPQFVNPPNFNPTSSGQYATALASWMLGDGLKLLPSSPARGKGIDPSMLPGLPAAIISDLRKYIYRDIQGKVRPGSGCDLGAYHQ